MSGFFGDDSGDAARNFGLALGLAGGIKAKRVAIEKELHRVAYRLNEDRAHALSNGAEADAYKALVSAMIAEAGRPEEFRHFSAKRADDARAKLLEDIHRMSFVKRLVDLTEENLNSAAPVRERTVKEGNSISEMTISRYRREVQPVPIFIHSSVRGYFK